MSQDIFNMIRNTDSIKIQIRSLRLDSFGFENVFPKFGEVHINGTRKIFVMPEPPNDLKKRHDEIFDITRLVKLGVNEICAFQIQKCNHPGHVIGIFLVKMFGPHDISNYVRNKRIENIG